LTTHSICQPCSLTPRRRPHIIAFTLSVCIFPCILRHWAQLHFQFQIPLGTESPISPGIEYLSHHTTTRFKGIVPGQIWSYLWRLTQDTMGGFYMAYLESLCRRRGWRDPLYETYRSSSGFTCLVLVNGREYQTDLAYESDGLAQENAAMRAFMVCRNFSMNGGMLARNDVVQGLPANESSSRHHKRRHGHGGRHHSVNLSSSSSTASSE